VAAGFAVALVNRCGHAASPARTCSAPKPTRSMRWGLRASPRRNGRRPAGCRIGRRRSCASWSGSAIACGLRGPGAPAAPARGPRVPGVHPSCA
jgi:hypothetical protein